jgi:hypothetical protein
LKRDTRGMLGGGPASQKPRNVIEQIRRLLPRTVTPVSLRYPQLLCVLRPVWRNFPSALRAVPFCRTKQTFSDSVKQLLTHLTEMAKAKLNEWPRPPSSSFQNQAGDSEHELRVR